jgi:LacI family transcriptional regulator
MESMLAPRRFALNGLARFMQNHESWLVYLKPTFAERALGHWLAEWNGDGILTTIHEEDKGELDHVRIPIVDLLGEFPQRGFPIVRTNDRLVGNTGADYLLKRGFRHFGFCELRNFFWSRLRREGFEERLRADGLSCQVHLSDPLGKGLGGPKIWEQHQQDLMQWIAALPKPAAVMTSTDLLGQQFLEACLRMQVHVPDVVAVIGVDNDEPICRLCSPPLSSVILDDEQRGYEAARLLSKLMAGEPPPEKPVLVPPAGVFERTSTDSFAIDDELLAKALRFLREHAHLHIGVEDVASALDVSRSLLERKIRKLLNRSINEEIVRLRINLAIQLLRETELDLHEIAPRCGFSSQAYMTTVFKGKVGRTPGLYRA